MLTWTGHQFHQQGTIYTVTDDSWLIFMTVLVDLKLQWTSIILIPTPKFGLWGWSWSCDVFAEGTQGLKLKSGAAQSVKSSCLCISALVTLICSSFHGLLPPTESDDTPSTPGTMLLALRQLQTKSAASSEHAGPNGHANQATSTLQGVQFTI